MNGEAIDIDKDQFLQVLRQWTNGEFNLVHVSPEDDHMTARRTGTLELQQLKGRNLYVRHRPANRRQRDHWESLRPATEVEKARNVARRRAGISTGRDFN